MSAPTKLKCVIDITYNYYWHNLTHSVHSCRVIYLLTYVLLNGDGQTTTGSLGMKTSCRGTVDVFSYQLATVREQ